MKSAILPTEILLPNGVDYQKWACIACDQFTSELEYWKSLENFVKEEKSTLKLTLPEIYLNDTPEVRIAKINQNIKDYLSNGILKPLKKGFILTVRTTPFVNRRIGLVGALDLEEYDFSKNSSSKIRATEGTIQERIPPRLKIREKADVEFPHVMVLFDDEKKEINEKLYENRENYKKLYDFDLNMNGGHLEGYFIDDYEEVLKLFNGLLDSDRQKQKYGKNDQFLFAVGDGNHSLATAKTHWENLKKTLSEKELENHPARYALVEFNNVYDDGIYFEPIFRYVTGIDKEQFIKKLNEKNIKGFKLLTENGITDYGKEELPKAILDIDAFIKEQAQENGGTVDYVHGEKNLEELVKSNPNSLGILFEKLDKKDLFKYVSNRGAFPKKTFSMGEGIEKRYYLEGRKIVK